MADKLHDGVTRRELFQIGNVLAMPVLLGGVKAHAEGTVAAGPLRPGPEIYQSIGVEPVINCRGTFTIIGGSVDGSICASERVEVQAGATVNGDITTRRIAVAEGGNLNGVIRMGEPADSSIPQAKPAVAKVETRPAAMTTAPVQVQALRPSVPIARVAVPPRLPSPGTGY